MNEDLSKSDSFDPKLTKRRRYGKTTLIFAVVASALMASGVTLVAEKHLHSGSKLSSETLYQCPMHPHIIRDKPGHCPICNMELVEIRGLPNSGSGAAKKDRKVAFYRSPMDAKQTSPVPRKDEMGMDYLPVYEDENQNQGAADKTSQPQGMAPVSLEPEKQEIIGLKTVDVKREVISGFLRTVGKIAIDETRVRHVNIKNGGYVERLFVNYMGKHVKKGEPMFTLFSPDLVAAQEEFLLALRTRNSSSGLPHSESQTLVDAAKRRLSLWDVTQNELDELEKRGHSTKTLTVYSPASGVITKKDIVEGMKLETGAMPLEIVDLSTVWALADVYESELRHVSLKTKAEIVFAAFPGRVFEGVVTFIDPLLNPESRTVKTRISVPNPSQDLRPEMFGEVTLKTPPREVLVIPADAIIDSGTSKIVFVSQGEHTFSPKTVEVGQSDGDKMEITKGLNFGDQVVSRANFLLDSESRFRALLAQQFTTLSSSIKMKESARVLPSTGVERNERSGPSLHVPGSHLDRGDKSFGSHIDHGESMNHTEHPK